MKIRDRIKELRRVPASSLVPNPKNWRQHPEEQANALRGVLSEIGIADAVLARELSDGSLMLLDGHLRAETLPDGDLPVLVLDVTEEEGDKLLATIDPLAAMAKSNKDALQGLLDNIETDSEAVQALLAATAHKAGLISQEIELGDGDFDEDEDEDDEDDAPPAGVRMVQLFLDENNIVEFQDAVSALSANYGTDNLTDTVLEAVKRAASSLQG